MGQFNNCHIIAPLHYMGHYNKNTYRNLMKIATSKFLYRISTPNKIVGDDVFTNDLNSATLFCLECARDYGSAAVYNHQTGKLIQTIGQS